MFFCFSCLPIIQLKRCHIYLNRLPSASMCLSNDQFINFGCFTHLANSRMRLSWGVWHAGLALQRNRKITKIPKNVSTCQIAWRKTRFPHMCCIFCSKMCGTLWNKCVCVYIYIIYIYIFLFIPWYKSTLLHTKDEKQPSLFNMIISYAMKFRIPLSLKPPDSPVASISIFWSMWGPPFSFTTNRCCCSSLGVSSSRSSCPNLSSTFWRESPSL